MVDIDRTQLSPGSSAAYTPSPRIQSRTRRRVMLMVALALTLLIGDWFIQNLEMNRLLTAVERAEAASIGGVESLRNVPVPTGPLVRGSKERKQVLANAASVASEAASATIDTAAEVSDVGILPWHTSLKKAQERYLNHSKEWQDDFSLQAKQFSEDAYVPAPNPRIDATFSIASRAFEAATPRLALFNIDGRIDEVFAEQ